MKRRGLVLIFFFMAVSQILANNGVNSSDPWDENKNTGSLANSGVNSLDPLDEDENTGSVDEGGVKFPAPLKGGEKIGIVAPAGPVKRERVDGAAEVLRHLGYEPVIYPTVDMEDGQFSGTPEQRWADLKDALINPEIRVVLCARGGYGMVHLLDSLATLPLEEDPKWVIGFSDITALHGLLASKGIASIHGSMALHLSRGMGEPENVKLINILKGKYPEYKFQANEYNHHGKAEGKLLGGNLSVLEGLINTPYDLVKPGTILFIEDVDEAIYKLERMMYQLKLSGAFDNLSGLILGRFTETPSTPNFESVEAMMHNILKDYPDLPVAYDIPIGHIRHNIPVIESSLTNLEVTPEGVKISMKEW